MVSDRLWRMVISLVVGIWVIRYLGPVNYGLINYVLAFIGIATVVTSFGMDGFLIKELISSSGQKNKLIYSAFLLRIIASCLSFLVVMWLLYFTNEPKNVFIIFLLVAPQLFTNAFAVVDLAFQAELRSKVTIICRNAFFVLGAILKLIAVFSHQNIYVFAALMVLDISLADIFLFFYYRKTNARVLFKELQLSYLKEISLKSMPFLFSSVAIVIYMKVDQILLGKLTSSKEVGYFSAATKISEIFYFIPLVITGSLFGLLINSRKESLQKFVLNSRIIFFSLVIFSCFISIGISFFAEPIISILFGTKFILSAGVLQIYIWSVIFIFAGVSFNQLLVIENLQSVIFYKTLIGVILNIILNLLLIPGYGAIGAALATVVTQFISSVGANFFFGRSRRLFLNYFFIPSAL